MTLPVEEPDYYDQFGPIVRRWRKFWDPFRARYMDAPMILLESKWRLGDEIMAIPVYEAWHRWFENEGVTPRIEAWCNYPELLEGNPYVHGVNDAEVRPNYYLKLRGVPRNVNRAGYYLKLLGIDPPLPVPKLYLENWDTSFREEISVGERAVIALCRGASWETKRWPSENWDELGRRLDAAGHRVIVLGQKGEEINVGTNFVGRTGVRDAACLLRRADLTISNDSGLMHLSLSAGTRTIGLFGPTASEILIRDNPDFHSIDNGRECQGCWNRDLSIEEPGSCPKHIDVCMETIGVDAVFEKAMQLVSIEET